VVSVPDSGLPLPLPSILMYGSPFRVTNQSVSTLTGYQTATVQKIKKEIQRNRLRGRHAERITIGQSNLAKAASNDPNCEAKSQRVSAGSFGAFVTDRLTDRHREHW